jgi:segregation and condensation protein A
MYQISTEQFTGPLDLLLQLVEKKNLEITEISLAQVTQDYMTYVGDQTLVYPEELADFLVIASTLLLIKSKSLLPTLELETEEQEEILNLENRLQLYKIYKEQGVKMYEIWNKHFYLFTRPPWKDAEVKFSPPKNISLSSLSQCFKKVLESFEEEIPLEEKKITKVVTLKQRIKELVHKLTQGKGYSLEELVPDKNKRIELILTFLAVLYLVKENIIKIKQEKNFGSIWISN